MQIAVGGCMAQKDRGLIVERALWVDVVLAPQHRLAPGATVRAAHNRKAEVEILESLEVFLSTLADPARLGLQRPGLDLGRLQQHLHVLASCPVCAARSRTAPARSSPRLRRSWLRASWRSRCWGRTSTPTASSSATAPPSASCCRPVARSRVSSESGFTSPHPAAFTEDVIFAMAETPNVMPSLHMPLQSGSDKVLRDMRRSYRSAIFLGIIDKVRGHIPDAAITTDIIVGFPGETEVGLPGTLDVVRAARFSSAFTFQYSIRPGTRGHHGHNQVPKAVVRSASTGSSPLRGGGQLGREPAPRGARGGCPRGTLRGTQGHRDQAHVGSRPGQLAVHFGVPQGAEVPRPGDVVTVGGYGAPHHLVADSGVQAGGMPSVALAEATRAALHLPSGTGKPAVSLECRRSADRRTPPVVPGCSTV